MKLKRLLTGVLSAVMALSVCAMPALAADAPAMSTSTINVNQRGSITIYKRAETQKATNRPASTGEAIADSSVPGEVLEGIGFKIFQVMTTEQLMTYYDGLTSGNDNISYKSFFKENTDSYTENDLKAEYKAWGTENGASATDGTAYTDKSGKASFEELPVGMYLVIETSTTQAVTSKVEPFLVSIPMTRIGADKDAANNKNQETWLYDVTVYPKNSIAKGDVTLQKNGVTSAGTSGLANVTFELYKKKDNDPANGYAKVDTITTGADGKYTFTALTKGSYYLMETGYTDSNNGYILDSDAKYAFDIDKDGKTVTSSDTSLTSNVTEGSFVISTEASPSVNLTINNYRPDLDKAVTNRNGQNEITKDNGQTEINREADYGIDDKVPYMLTVKVPQNITKLQTFKVTDTTEKAELVHNQDAELKCAGRAVATDAYKVTLGSEDGATKSCMVITFTPANMAVYAGKEITITYTATLQKGAQLSGGANLNSAKLTYSRKAGTYDETQDGNKPYEIVDKSVVYTFGLGIEKVAQGGQQDGNGLNGVTFDLYKKHDPQDQSETLDPQTNKYMFRGKPCDYITVTAQNPAFGLDDGIWIKVKTLATAKVGEKDGIASESGLPAGEYKLVETKTLDGYNLLSKAVDAKLNLEYTTNWTTNDEYGTDGTLTKHEYASTKVENPDKSSYTTVPDIKIVNRAGFTLPVTGGFGTLLFSGIGVLLVLAGVCVLFSMKKKNNRA